MRLHARVRGAEGERGPNIVALADWALGTPLVQAADDDCPWLWSQLATAAMSVFGAGEGEARDLLERGERLLACVRFGRSPAYACAGGRELRGAQGGAGNRVDQHRYQIGIQDHR